MKTEDEFEVAELESMFSTPDKTCDGSHNIRCCGLQILQHNGNNGALMSFRSAQNLGKLTIGCAADSDVRFKWKLDEPYYAEVTLRRGNLYLRNLSQDSKNAPIFCNRPVGDEIALPVGAMFAIQDRVFCLECNEMEHTRKPLSGTLALANRRMKSKRRPYNSLKSIAKRQKLADSDKRLCEGISSLFDHCINDGEE
jgi:hypothetical protein